MRKKGIERGRMRDSKGKRERGREGRIEGRREKEGKRERKGQITTFRRMSGTFMYVGSLHFALTADFFPTKSA